MNTLLFALSLLAGVAGPVIAITYLRPILFKVLTGLCDAAGGAEFWIRCAYLLAVSGTLLLILSFGLFEPGTDPVNALRRALWLVFAGVFGTVALIARNVWDQVRVWLAARNGPAPATTA